MHHVQLPTVLVVLLLTHVANVLMVSSCLEIASARPVSLIAIAVLDNMDALSSSLK